MRAAQAVMSDLAASGLSPAQLALVMELSATVAAEARPAVDEAAERRRERDREYQAERRRNRQTSADSTDATPSPLSPPKVSPRPPTNTPPLSPNPDMRAEIGRCLQIAFPPPDGVGDEQWAAFCKQRRKKLNDRSYLLLTNKLARLAESGWPPGEMIDRAIESGWETVFAPNTKSGADPPKRYVSASGYEYRGDLDAIQREAERRGDTDTYWQVKVDRRGKAQSVGQIAENMVGRAA